jgi:hypothetical protein
MPWWVTAQIIAGLVLGAGALLLGIRRRKALGYLVGDLLCSLTRGVLLIAYWDIRVNAALGGWVIPFFVFGLAWQTAATLRSFRSTEGSRDYMMSPGMWQGIEATRAIVYLIPAIYLGGVLTYRIWYPPPLDDALTHGAESVGALRAALNRMIPLGSPAAAARDSLERYGFACFEPERSYPRAEQGETSCNKRVPTRDSMLRRWQLTLVQRHDSIRDIRVVISPAQP